MLLVEENIGEADLFLLPFFDLRVNKKFSAIAIFTKTKAQFITITNIKFFLLSIRK